MLQFYSMSLSQMVLVEKWPWRLLKVDPLARVILFRGYADSDLMIRAEELGFKGRLAKPFTTPELAALIQGVLS